MLQNPCKKKKTHNAFCNCSLHMAPIQARPLRKVIKVNSSPVPIFTADWIPSFHIMQPIHEFKRADCAECGYRERLRKRQMQQGCFFLFIFFPTVLCLPLSFRNLNHLSHFSPLSAVSCCQASSNTLKSNLRQQQHRQQQQ